MWWDEEGGEEDEGWEWRWSWKRPRSSSRPLELWTGDGEVKAGGGETKKGRMEPLEK